MIALKTAFCVLAICSLALGYSIESRIKRNAVPEPPSPVGGSPQPEGPAPPSSPVDGPKPEVPQVPGVPSVPQPPQVPEVPSVPQVPSVPGVPSADSIPKIPGLPSGDGDAQVPQIPGIPSGIPQIPSMPGFGNIASQFGPEIFQGLAERFKGAVKDTIDEEKNSVQNGIGAIKDQIQQNIKTGVQLAKTQADLGLAFPKLVKNFVSRN